MVSINTGEVLNFLSLVAAVWVVISRIARVETKVDLMWEHFMSKEE